MRGGPRELPSKARWRVKALGELPPRMQNCLGDVEDHYEKEALWPIGRSAPHGKGSDLPAPVLEGILL